MDVPDNVKRNLVSEGIERSRQTLLSGNPGLRNNDGGTLDAWNNVFNQVVQ